MPTNGKGQEQQTARSKTGFMAIINLSQGNLTPTQRFGLQG